VHDGFGVQLTLTELDELKDDVSAKLAALDADSLVKVQALVVEWDVIRTQTAKIMTGGIGNLSGLDYDVEKKQARIRQLLHTYVPALHMADAKRRKRGPVGVKSAQIDFVRN
jgi:hypothetical protein